MIKSFIYINKLLSKYHAILRIFLGPSFSSDALEDELYELSESLDDEYEDLDEEDST